MKSHHILSVFISFLIVLFVLNSCSKTNSSYGNNNNPTGTGGNPNAVSIKSFAFSVSSLNVSSGTKVTWTNNDATAHTVTADDNSFDSGNIAPGATFSHTFSAAGTYPYHCTYHSMMTAEVVVK